MSITLIAALLANPVVAPAAKPVPKTNVVCTDQLVSNSRFTRKECISKARANQRSRNAEDAWRGMQNATGATPSEGPTG